jgi:molecular chaperone GrpE
MNDVSQQVLPAEGKPGDPTDSVPAENSSFTLLGERIGALERQVGFIPPQIRQLVTKVDSLTTSVAEPRMKALLLGLVGIYDLIDQLARNATTTETSGTDHGRNYRVLRSQLRVLLETNGLIEIAAEGAFDPLFHCALQSVAVEDPVADNRIVEVIRTGFRTDHAVLRYAEVVVARYSPRPEPAREAIAAEPEGAQEPAVERTDSAAADEIISGE